MGNHNRPYIVWGLMSSRISGLVRGTVFVMGIVLAIWNTGCVAVVAAGAAAGGTAAYIRGELETNLPAAYEDAVRASNKAITDLQFAPVNQKKDALKAVLLARTAEDKKVEIRLDRIANDVTRLRIRVGVIGDQGLSLAVFEKIRANL